MMNNYQQAVFEQISAGMNPHDKELLRQECERRAQEQADSSRTVAQMQYWAQRSQHEINTQQPRHHSIIVAVDLHGGFSKDGKIPWHYKEDFEWFKTTTSGHICVMGRATYEDINNRVGSAGDGSVLPNRNCFVVTSSALPRSNATTIRSLVELDKHLVDVDDAKKVFYIGGERIYQEGIAKCDSAYVTVVNQVVNADKYFPVKYLSTHFTPVRNQRANNAPDLRFTTWTRK